MGRTNQRVRRTGRNVPTEEYWVSDKSRLLMLILCICLGWFGVHWFYVGRKIEGGITLVLSVFLLISILGGSDVYYSMIDSMPWVRIIFMVIILAWIIGIVGILSAWFTDNEDALIYNW